VVSWTKSSLKSPFFSIESLVRLLNYLDLSRLARVSSGRCQKSSICAQVQRTTFLEISIDYERRNFPRKFGLDSTAETTGRVGCCHELSSSLDRRCSNSSLGKRFDHVLDLDYVHHHSPTSHNSLRALDQAGNF